MNQPTSPQVIEVIVKTDGSTSVSTKGFVGSACRRASAFLRKALGNSQAEKLTDEFHQVIQQDAQNRLKHR